MTEPDWSRNAKLEMNARHFRYSPIYEKAVGLFYSDREAWLRLPVEIRSGTSDYEDFRSYHEAAVKAGVITEFGRGAA